MTEQNGPAAVAENAQMQSGVISGGCEEKKHLTLDDLTDEEILDHYRTYRAGSIAQIKITRHVMDVMSKSLQGMIDMTALLAIYGYGEAEIENTFSTFITLDAYVRRRFPGRRLDIHD